MHHPAALLACLLLACGGAPAASETGSPTTTDAPPSTSVTTTQPVLEDSSTGTADLPTGSGGDSLGGTSTSTGDATTTAPPDTTTTSSSTTTTTDTTDSSTGDPLPPLTLAHAQFKGTHNSYHLKPLIPFDASHDYSHAPLDIQLAEQGVRAFELDVHEGLGGFEVYHITVIDALGTCDTLKGCLGDLRTWSKAHPQHLPIVVWIEIKDSTGGTPIDAGDLDKLDDAIRDVLGPEQLYTPDDLQGPHASIRDALDADGWPALDLMRGQILVVLLDVDDAHAADYTADYTTLAGRAMFARATPAQFTAPWAAIAKLGIDDTRAIHDAHAADLLIATNVCGAGEPDDDCSLKLEQAKAAGIHMLKDDFPAPIAGKTYFMDLQDGAPARCNPVTAPPGCTSLALEAL